MEYVLYIIVLMVLPIEQCFGYVNSLPIDQNLSPNWLANSQPINDPFAATPLHPQLEYPYYEITTIRPPSNILNWIKSSSTVPSVINSMYKLQNSFHPPPIGPLSPYTFDSVPSDNTFNQLQPYFNPQSNPFNTFPGEQYSPIQQNLTQVLHTNEDYLHYMYKQNPIMHLMNYNDPTKFTMSIKEAPSVMKGIQNSVMRMVINIKSMLGNVWNYVMARFKPAHLSNMHGRSITTDLIISTEIPKTVTKSTIATETAKHHKVHHKKHHKKHSHKHKHKKLPKKTVKHAEDEKPSHRVRYRIKPQYIPRRKHKIKKHHMKKYMMPLLMAYKMKFFTLIPVVIAGLILLTGSTGMAGFFFALFAAALSMNHKMTI